MKSTSCYSIPPAVSTTIIMTSPISSIKEIPLSQLIFGTGSLKFTNYANKFIIVDII